MTVRFVRLLVVGLVPFLALLCSDLSATPFVWRGVVLVHALCVLPLLCLGAVSLRPCCGGAWCVVGAVVLATVVSVCLAQAGLAASGTLVRVGMAALLLSPVAVAVAAGFPGSPQRAISWLLAVLLAVPVPAIFDQARCAAERIRLEELLEQSRLGEASALAVRLQRFDPRALIRDRQIARVAAELKQTVNKLSASVAGPLSAMASDQDRLNRARTLAILGRNGEALALIESMASRDADAWNLAGTICETQEDWAQGLAHFRMAQRLGEERGSAERPGAQLARSWQGQAYCLRKSGQYPAAEHAYRQLLRQSSTPDVHFLLAQFYEDTQQPTAAAVHARQAAQLAPGRFAEPVRQMTRRLATASFGCFAIPGR